MSLFRSLCMKAQCLRELRIRYGFGSTISTIVFDPFEFRSQTDVEWRNIEQLEAVVEFFANYRPDPVPMGADTWGDPWAQDAKPLDDNHPDYVHVNLGRLEGTAAEVTAAPGGNWVQLDGDPDLSDVIVNPENPNNPLIVGAPAPPAGFPPRRRFLYDTLWLDVDTRRPSKLYRVMEVNLLTKSVRLDEAPNFGGKKNSKWRLNRRPIIVLIDPIGPRRNDGPPANVWSGARATVIGRDPANANWTVLQLDGAQPLRSINLRFDTVYLPDASGSAHKPPRTYRIMAVAAPPTRQISVDGMPNLPANGSRWHIPAGLSGAQGPLSYTLAPPANPAERAARGTDHYDGTFFIVHNGQVMHRFRWTSYTSRDWGPWSAVPPGEDWRDYLSSLRGNGRYYYSTYRSGNSFRNYSFAVIESRQFAGFPLFRPLPPHWLSLGNNPSPATRPGDPPRPWDTVRYARYYAGTPVPPAPAVAGAPAGLLQPIVMRDPNGKVQIRLHMGRGGAGMAGIGTGSAGCMVVPLFPEMRTALIRIFNQEYRAFYGGPGPGDPAIQPLNGVPHSAPPPAPSAVSIYNANTVTQQGWDDKLVGHLWLIRPDEPPVS